MSYHWEASLVMVKMDLPFVYVFFYKRSGCFHLCDDQRKEVGVQVLLLKGESEENAEPLEMVEFIGAVWIQHTT